MNDVSSPALAPPPTESRIARAAAISSLLAPVVVVLIYILLFAYIRSHVGTHGPKFGILAFAFFVFLPLLLIPVGVALGFAARVLTKRSKLKGVLGLGLVGIWVNCVFFVLIIVPAVFAVILGPAFVNVWRQMSNP
jgi:hypothetical protein